MTENIPPWAIKQLKANLPADTPLLNVARHSRSTVVANTPLGAAVVTKKWFGAARVSLLANPENGAAPAASTPGTPFVHNGYTLHCRKLDLKNGGSRPIYFFAKSVPKSGSPVALPTGFQVGVNGRTGLPFLRKGNADPTTVSTYRPQCSALTDGGPQCRNSARGSSKYCASHFGYQPPTIAKANARKGDTKPRVRKAPDTLPSVRRRFA